MLDPMEVAGVGRGPSGRAEAVAKQASSARP